MATGYQQFLQGERPTTSNMGGVSASTSGIDLLTTGVKLAETTIGSSYAERQMERGIDAAINESQRSRAALVNLNNNLADVTERYYKSGRPPELLAQMKKLEDTVRSANLGQGQGALSGIAAKARIESAYKQAIDKFPTFQSELRAHYDSYTGQGAIANMLEADEINKEIAKSQAMMMSKDMAALGMNYFNEDDRIVYSTNAARLGELKTRNDFLLADLTPKKSLLEYEQAQLNYKQGQIEASRKSTEWGWKLEDRPMDVASKELSLKSSKFNYDKSQVEWGWANSDRPDALAKRELELEAARMGNKYTRDTMDARIASANSNSRVDQSTENYRIEQARIDHENAILKQQERSRAEKFMADPKNRFVDLAEEALTPLLQRFATDKALSGDQRKALVTTTQYELRDKFAKAARNAGISLDHPAIAAEMKVVEDQIQSLSDMAGQTDPIALQENVEKMKRLMARSELARDPNINTLMALGDNGLLTVLDRVIELKSKALSAATPLERSKLTAEYDTYAKAYKPLLDLTNNPQQFQKEFEEAFKTGKMSAGIEVGVADTVQNANELPQKDKESLVEGSSGNKSTFELSLGSPTYGLQNLASSGAGALARLTPKAQEQYVRAFNDHFQQTANLLPVGFSLRVSKGGALDVVQKGKDGSEKVIDTLSVVGKPVYGNADLMGFPKIASQIGQSAWEGFDISQLAEDASYIVKAYKQSSDLVGGDVTKVSVKQNKNFIGSAGDMIGGAVDYFVNGANDSALMATLREQLTGSYSSPVKGFDDSLVKRWAERGSKYADAYQEAGKKYGIDPTILIRQGAAESGFWNEDIISGSKRSEDQATGIAQFLPPAAKEVGLIVDGKDYRTDPYRAIDAQAKYLKMKLDEAKKDFPEASANELMRYALAAYNAGYGNVKNYKGIPPFKETADYLSKILGG